MLLNSDNENIAVEPVKFCFQTNPSPWQSWRRCPPLWEWHSQPAATENQDVCSGEIIRQNKVRVKSNNETGCWYFIRFSVPDVSWPIVCSCLLFLMLSMAKHMYFWTWNTQLMSLWNIWAYVLMTTLLKWEKHCFFMQKNQFFWRLRLVDCRVKAWLLGDVYYFSHDVCCDIHDRKIPTQTCQQGHKIWFSPEALFKVRH